MDEINEKLNEYLDAMSRCSNDEKQAIVYTMEHDKNHKEAMTFLDGVEYGRNRALEEMVESEQQPEFMGERIFSNDYKRLYEIVCNSHHPVLCSFFPRKCLRSERLYEIVVCWISLGIYAKRIGSMMADKAFENCYGIQMSNGFQTFETIYFKKGSSKADAEECFIDFCKESDLVFSERISKKYVQHAVCYLSHQRLRNEEKNGMKN